MMWEQSSSVQKAVSKDMDEDRYYVARFLSGEESAFSFLVNKYRKPIYHIAYRFTHNSQEADDITQDTFVKAYQGLVKFRGDASFKTWLFRIATNLSINTTKSGRIRKDSGEAPEDSAPPIDLAHATLPTSTGWDPDCAGDPLSAGQIQEFYAAYLRRLGPERAGLLRPWLMPMRRLTWLRTMTWFARWRAQWSGEAAAARQSQLVSDHIARHIYQSFDPATIAATRHEWLGPTTLNLADFPV